MRRKNCSPLALALRRQAVAWNGNCVPYKVRHACVPYKVRHACVP